MPAASASSTRPPSSSSCPVAASELASFQAWLASGGAPATAVERDVAALAGRAPVRYRGRAARLGDRARFWRRGWRWPVPAPPAGSTPGPAGSAPTSCCAASWPSTVHPPASRRGRSARSATTWARSSASARSTIRAPRRRSIPATGAAWCTRSSSGSSPATWVARRTTSPPMRRGASWPPSPTRSRPATAPTVAPVGRSCGHRSGGRCGRTWPRSSTTACTRRSWPARGRSPSSTASASRAIRHRP